MPQDMRILPGLTFQPDLSHTAQRGMPGTFPVHPTKPRAAQVADRPKTIKGDAAAGGSGQPRNVVARPAAAAYPPQPLIAQAAQAEPPPARPMWVPPYYERPDHSPDNESCMDDAICGMLLGVALGATAGVLITKRHGGDSSAKGAFGTVGSGIGAITGMFFGFIAQSAFEGITQRTTRLVNNVSYAKYQIQGQIRREKPMDLEQGFRDDRTPVPVIEKNADRVKLRGQGLTRVPALPRTAQNVDLSKNNLTNLRPEPWKDLIHYRSRCDAHGVRVDLRGNQLREVPLFLFDLHYRSEIDLRNNPISEEEERAVLAEQAARRAKGQKVPEFLFNRLPDVGLRGLETTNVHSEPLVTLFRIQLNVLATRYPDVAPPGASLNFDQFEATLLEDMQKCAARNPGLVFRSHNRIDRTLGRLPDHRVLDLARDAVMRMVRDGRGGIAVRDFEPYSAAHVLKLVAHVIDTQPSEEERDRGLVTLMHHLAFARGLEDNGDIFCDTRHCEEALSALTAAYSQDVAATDELPAGTVVMPDDNARDALVAASKPILSRLLADAPTVTDATLRDRFGTALQASVQAHGNITHDQVETFLRDFAFADWDTFREVATQNEAVPATA